MQLSGPCLPWSCLSWIGQQFRTGRPGRSHAVLILEDTSFGAEIAAVLGTGGALVRRTAIEILERIGTRGLESILIAQFDGASPDVKELILQAVAKAFSDEAFAFLRSVILNHSLESRLGRLARAHLRATAGTIVLMGDDRETRPAEATLAKVDEGYGLILYNLEGFRVAVSGHVWLQCAGRIPSDLDVAPSDFHSSGVLFLGYPCSDYSVPAGNWRSLEGQPIELLLDE